MHSNTPGTLEELDKRPPQLRSNKTVELTGGEYIPQFESSHISIGTTETVVPKKSKESDVITSDEGKYYYSIPKGRSSIFLKNEKAIKIARAYYTKDIIQCLNWIGEHHKANSPDAIAGFQKLFCLINAYTEKSLKDPYASLLLSLYQGLIFEEKWVSINPKIFPQIGKLLKGYNNRNKIDFDDIDNALLQFEKFGINPTPF